MIRLENIHKVFKSKSKELIALQNIHLDIGKGDVFGVIGYSGSGKSTLVRTINLLERPTVGKVYVDNVDISSFSDAQLIPYRRKIGMIFQQFNLLTSSTVFENIAFPLRLSGWSKEKVRQKVDSLLSLIDMEDKKYDYPVSLSGGQKQRVAIARALASEPEILLCDEATSALDPQTTRSILSLLKKINKEMNITIVLITHEMEVVKAICNRVAVISNGQVVEQGLVHPFFAAPQTDVARELLNPSLTLES